MVLRRPATPPMGWNSWDCFGTTVTEAEVLANARFMAEHLLPLGYDTVVVDIDWADPTARSHGYNDGAPLHIDGYGRLVPDPVRFPSSEGGRGFGPLVAAVHGMGLRFGIHIMRGVPRRAVAAATPVLGTRSTAADIADPDNVCEWNPDMLGIRLEHAAGRAYYDSIVALYAEWGVDFIKADDMLWPYQAAEIEALHAAIESVDREVVLSLSPGRDLSLAHAEHLGAHASMWRVSDDLWDDWDAVVANAARLARWAPVPEGAGWPDGDMLPLGRIGVRAERGDPRDDAFTVDERRSLLTLWAMARSPFMIGGDLPTSDPATIGLLAEPGLVEVLRESRAGREVLRERDLVVWTAESDGCRWAAIVNLSDSARDEVFDVRALGLPAGPGREVWTGARVQPEPVRVQSDAARSVAPGSAAVRVHLAAHGCVLVRVERAAAG